MVTSTTHKTFAGPRAGVILSTPLTPPRSTRQCSPVFRAGRCATSRLPRRWLQAAASDAFKAYQQQIVANAKTLAETLMDGGLDCSPAAPTYT